MSRTTEKAELPDSGERVNMTLTDVGFVNTDSDSKPTKLVIKAIVDEGSHKKTELSHAIPWWDMDHKLLELEDAIGKSFNRGEKSYSAFLAPVRELRRKARLSAQIVYEEYENRRTRGVKSKFVHIDKPTKPAELKLKPLGNQFER